jgi:4-amino-4-deoxy-L-arabinose transferase-like glycosyltransferase
MSAWLARSLAARWALLLAVLLNLIWGFWASPLYDLDEGAFTEATREMMVSGNYTSIYLNGEPRNDKPILIYWLQAASAHVFGFNEFSLRLPSVLAGLGWVWALFAFARRHTDRDTAQVAALLLSLSLYVGLIDRAAVADALLNLFLALAMFDIYSYFRAPERRLQLRIFVWLGLGFLTKGPVAVFFPFLVSGLFYLSYGRWREWLRAVFDPLGLAIFVAIVLPWHIAVYLDSGWEFFRGFYLKQNIGRYTGAMEGHSGSPLYYVMVAPLIVMPFAGWLIATLRQLPRAKPEPLDRYVWLWFFSVLIVFSFSGTKLPHYLLYGMSGVYVLMAAHRETLRNRWLQFAPALAFLGLFALLPQAFGLLQENTHRAYDKLMFSAGAEAFAGIPQWSLLGILLLGVGVTFLRTRLWQRVLLLGYVQALAVAVLVLPLVMGVLQNGPRAAGLYAKQHGKQLVFFRAYQPSVSVYAGQVIEHRPAQPGEWAYVRTDNLQRYMDQPSPYRRHVVFQQGPATLVAVDDPQTEQH